MLAWQPRESARDPLLWSLHLGHAWIPVGLLLVAAGDLGLGVPASAGLHALTAGAMGTTILAVMTRVGLGHTGRPLVPPRGTVWVYALAHAGALVRSAAPLLAPSLFLPGLAVAGALWAGAFGLFALLYAPILARARVDGLPG